MANIGSCMGDGINKCDYCEFRDLCAIRNEIDSTDSGDPCEGCPGPNNGNNSDKKLYPNYLRWWTKG